MPVKYPDIKVRLVGEDGNAYAILARAMREMKRARVPQSDLNQFFTQATSSDYSHLLATVCAWVHVK